LLDIIILLNAHSLKRQTFTHHHAACILHHHASASCIMSHAGNFCMCRLFWDPNPTSNR
jgi:hypothetical protein